MKLNKLQEQVRNVFLENTGFEPELKTIIYYCLRIRNNEFTLDELPIILNPKQSHLYEKERNDFNINFFERRFFSQWGEDGIIDFIFSEIATTNKFFVEFGVEDGTECNTRYLLEKKGWRGLMMDGGDNLKPYVKQEFITAANVNELFNKYHVPKYFDLLSIDIDFNDYWIWKSIVNFVPRVVIIEYNSSIPPDESKVVPYDPFAKWDKTNYFGASLFALMKLGLSKGYCLIGCTQRGVNAFFIKNEFIPKWVKLKTIQELYRPPQYGIIINGKHVGHPSSTKKMIEV